VSIHQRKNGSWTVRWRDLGRQRSRDFHSKKEAERFDKRLKKARKDRDRGVIRFNEDAPFDPQHPKAFEQILFYIEETLEFQYPNHTFTFTSPAEEPGPDGEDVFPIVDDLPLTGAIQWEGITKAEHQRNIARTSEAFEKLRAQRPELFSWEDPDPDDPLDEGGWNPDGGKLGKEALYVAMNESGLFDE
jgi:hypothetical protein